MQIDEPGIYNLQPEDYHADPCPQPALSSSCAKLLDKQAPIHAYYAHPRLGMGDSDNSRLMDFGSLCHAKLLGVGEWRVLPYNDYRKKAAQEDRDQAYGENIIPVLEKDDKRSGAVINALRKQLVNHHDAGDAFVGGQAEQTLIWYEEDYDIWCRALVDHVAQANWLEDYKTTEGGADPDTWQKRLFNDGNDIQAAFYLRGWKKLTGEDRYFRFIVQEVRQAPYCASVIAPDAYALQQANEKVEAAMQLWADCLHNNTWPGYPAHTCWVSPPAFADKAHEDRQMRNQIAQQDGHKLKDLMLKMQAPLEDA